MPGWQSIHRIGKPVQTSIVRHTRIIQWRMHSESGE
nr:MAG TPA: Rubisco Assembly chaperone C-terminal domain [Caudoviricetes sp.]